ncbi:stage III sporulation protein AF [Peribacillus huizhouensis]|uniref:Stage III sporulation protein AF n=1 Tax=Peribacillus huizhouensis TaxID=1501239 RepID=A0ABR6CQS7_9BACI|nr:stage III sporulation protein AF [Peribacillus huizhouensis]MBA9027389.1 stage III sporulation protein AF [Peribacillus huizhouensis]
MEFITSWVTNIIVFVLLATVIDMLLPNSSMQKYAKMVIGLLLIAVIISPILKLFQSDFDELLNIATSSIDDKTNHQVENLTDLKKKEIQAVQDAYILKQMAADMRTGVEEEMIERYKMAIQSMELEVKNKDQPNLPEDLQKILIVLHKTTDEAASVEVVAKVEIDTKQSSQTSSSDLDHIREFLAAKWAVDEKIIEFAGERGG